MADFTSQRAFKTREAVLKVDPGLAPGVHTFELIVQDSAGNSSKPAQIKVEIVRIRIPIEPTTPIITGPVSPTPISTIRRSPTR